VPLLDIIVVFVVCSYDIMFFKTLENLLKENSHDDGLFLMQRLIGDDGQYYS
jgi:hypothetical protein